MSSTTANNMFKNVDICIRTFGKLLCFTKKYVKTKVNLFKYYLSKM